MTDYKFCPQCATPVTAQDGHPHCDNCGLTIYQNPAPTVGVFIVKGDEVLLSKRAIEPFKGYLDTIGGFLDAGETLAAGAKREVKEETGLDIELLELLDSYPDVYSDEQRRGEPLLAFNFVARVVGDDTKMRPMDDVASLHWVKIGEVPVADMAFGANKAAIKDLRRWQDRQA